MAADDDVRITGSWDSDIEQGLDRLERKLDSAEGQFDDTGRAAEQASQKIERGAKTSEQASQRQERAARGAAAGMAAARDASEKAQRAFEEQAAAATEAAKAAERVDTQSRGAAAGMAAARAASDRAARAYRDNAEAAAAAARANDDAGDEAAGSGTKAGLAAALWNRYTRAIQGNERALAAHNRVAAMWDRTQRMVNATQERAAKVADYSRSRWRSFLDLDWAGTGKKVMGLSKYFMSFSMILKGVKLALMAIVLKVVLGFLSALAAGAISAAGGIASMSRGLLAALPILVAAKLGMLAWTKAAEAVAPQLDAIKKRFDGLGEAVARGGLRAGLAQLNGDMGQFAMLTEKGFEKIGRSLGQSARDLGVVLKNGERMSQVARIYDTASHNLDYLATAGMRVAEAFVSILDAAGPTSLRLASDVRDLTMRFMWWADAMNRSGAMTAHISKGYDALRRTAKILSDLFIALFNVFRIGARESGWMADGIENLTKKFRDWTESIGGQQAIAQYFRDSMPAVKEFALLIGAILGGIGGMATSEGLAPLINQIRTETLPAFSDLFEQVSGQGGLIPSLLDGFTELAKMFTSLDLSGLTMLAQAFADVTEFVTGLIQANPWLAQLISMFAMLYVVGGVALKIIGGGMMAFGWIKGAITLTGELTLAQKLLGKTVAGLKWAAGYAAAAFRGMLFGLTGASTVMGGLTVIARAMWTAITGPIGLVVLAIAAVVAAFIWAYNNVDWFREAVDAAVKWIVDAFWWFVDVAKKVWEAVSTAISDAWTVYILPVLTAIWTVLKFVGAIIFTVLVAPFVIAWNILTALFTWAWESIIAPVLGWIGDKFVWLYENAVKPAMDWISQKWNDTLMGIQLIWQTILYPALQMMGDFFVYLWNTYVQPVLDKIKIGWDAMVMAMQLIWQTILRPALQAVGDFFGWLWNVAVKPILDFIQQRWEQAAAGMQIIQQTVIQPVFDAIGRGLETLQGWFRTAVDNVAAVWNELKSKLAVPINFLIDTVWNNGVLKVWNWVAEKLGLPMGAPVAKIPEYATGGRISGPGTGTSDSIIAAVSNGEHVWTANEVRKAGGHRRVQQLRALALQGGMGAVDSFLNFGGESLRQFAEGGAVAAGQGWAKGEAGKPYIWGGVGPAGYDCSGFMSAITNFLTSSPIHRRIFATGSFSANRGAGGFVPGLGSAFAIGVSPNTGGGIGHMAGTLGGMNVESRGSDGVVVGTRARGANNSLFPWQFSLPQAGGSFVGGDGGGWTWDIAKMALDAIINPIINSIPFNGPPQWMDIPKAMATKGRDEMYAWAQEKLEAIMSMFGGGQTGMGAAAVRAAVQQMAARFGWGDGPEWNALDKLIQGESGWNPNAANPSSSARGLFQKMTSLHGPLEPSIAGQALWGLNYIRGAYGTPSNAWAKWSSRSPHWYDDGGYLQPGLSMVYNGTGHPEPVFTASQWDVLEEGMAPASSGGYGYDPAIVEQLDEIATLLYERPPALAVNSTDTERAVRSALRADRREREARARYQY